MTVEEDGAVIVGGDDLQTRWVGCEVREECGGELEHAMITREREIISNNYPTV